MKIDVFTLFPPAFAWFLGQRHVRQRARRRARDRVRRPAGTTPLSAGQVDDTPFGGGAGMVLRVDVMEAALRRPLRRRPGRPRAARRRVIALTPAGRLLDDACAAELAAEED